MTESSLPAEVEHRDPAPPETRYVRIFTTKWLERRKSNTHWNGSPSLDSMATEINMWAEDAEVRIISLDMIRESGDPILIRQDKEEFFERMCYAHMRVLYSPIRPDVYSYDIDRSTKRRTLEPLPLPTGAKAPTIEVTLQERAGIRPVQVMAGMIGVVEGTRLHPEDDEPAPLPLFGPDVDLTPYRKLFGNVEAFCVRQEPANSAA